MGMPFVVWPVLRTGDWTRRTVESARNSPYSDPFAEHANVK